MATAFTARGKLGRRAAWRRANPAASVDPTGHTEESACLNCGTLLQGAFCHQCGQHAHVHRTLGAFGHDLLHGVLHLEGKVWHTLPKLMFRPGELTRRYIAGERARFVSPLAMFLFSVFLMFAVMGLLGSPQGLFGSGDVQSGLREELTQIEGRLSDLQRQRAEAAARGDSTTKLDQDIRDGITARDVVRGLAGEDTSLARSDTPSGGTAGRREIATGTVGDQPIKISLNAEDDGALQNAYGEAYRTAKQNPKLLLYKLQTNAYKFSWLLILISVPFVALLFLWRWRPLYDHTVFVTYSITAVSILVIAGSLLVLAGVAAGPVMLAATLFIPWHMYRQLRGGYGLRRFSALWRMVAMTVFAGMALGLFAFALLMMGVLA